MPSLRLLTRPAWHALDIVRSRKLVRPADEYRAAHVAGAVSIPIAELERRLREVPREREVVAYCRGPYCAFAPEAVRTLREHGYNARYLTEGLPEWADAGRSIEVQGPS